MDYKALSFVLAGSLRQRVIKALQKPKTPSQLVKDLKTQDSSLSRTLKELEEHKIIDLNELYGKKDRPVYDEAKIKLRVPRRPRWTAQTTAEQLHQMENV